MTASIRDCCDAPLREIAETLGDVLWIADAATQCFVWVSPAGARHGRGDPQRLPGDASPWFDVIHPDDRPRLRERFARLAIGEGYEDEYRTVGAAGDERWVAERVFAAGAADGAGPPQRWVGITQDCTLRKRAEALLVDAGRRKDEYLAALAHELRSPLAPILGAVDVLASPRTDADAKANALRIVRRQADHLARRVDDLLDVARVVQGRIELDRKPLELQGVIAAAIEAAQPLLQSRGHTLVANLPDAGVWVDADRARLAQALGHLLDNAARYTPPEGAIRIEAEARADRVRVTVADNGAGIAADALPHVFDFYAQAGPAAARAHSGLGVGLAVARRVLRMHEGDLEAASEGAGRGSRFTLTLPRCAAPPVQAAAAAPRTAPRGGALRILAVDDNEDTLETMAMLLEAQGHAVHMATHADAALRLARDIEPQLVLLDIGLPGMNGYELAGALRELPLAEPPVLVAISGYGRDDDRRRASEAGFEHHLVKPAEPERLLAIIAGVAERRRGVQNSR